MTTADKPSGRMAQHQHFFSPLLNSHLFDFHEGSDVSIWCGVRAVFINQPVDSRAQRGVMITVTDTFELAILASMEVQEGFQELRKIAARIQATLNASSPCGLQIGGLVAYENATTDIYWKALQEILDHPGCGLTSMAYLTIPLYQRVGMKRTIFECVYVSSDLRQIFRHPSM